MSICNICNKDFKYPYLLERHKNRKIPCKSPKTKDLKPVRTGIEPCKMDLKPVRKGNIHHFSVDFGTSKIDYSKMNIMYGCSVCNEAFINPYLLESHQPCISVNEIPSEIDYSKTIIYKLICNEPNVKDVYVGSTTNFNLRKKSHEFSITNKNSEEYSIKKSITIRENGGWDNWSMVEIEKYEDCKNKSECLKRERYWIDYLEATMNSVIPTGRHVAEGGKRCIYCLKSFVRIEKHICKMKDDYVRRIEMKLDIEPEKVDKDVCRFCQKQFMRSDSLNRHLLICKEKDKYEKMLENNLLRIKTPL